VVSSEVDFVPIPDEFSMVNEYLAFVRRHNNICYRNVEVVDLIPGEPCSSSFLLRGLPDRADTFRLEVNHWLPAGTRVVVEMMQMRQELELTALIEESPPVHYPPHIIFEPSTERPPLVFSNLHLEKESTELVRVQITLPDDAPSGVYLIYADQYLGETQLGRVNYVLQVSE
jgi:hypothetical protein